MQHSCELFKMELPQCNFQNNKSVCSIFIVTRDNINWNIYKNCCDLSIILIQFYITFYVTYMQFCATELKWLRSDERIAEDNRRWELMKNSPDVAEYEQSARLLPKRDPAAFSEEEMKIYVSQKHKEILKLVTYIHQFHFVIVRTKILYCSVCLTFQDDQYYLHIH